MAEKHGIVRKIPLTCGTCKKVFHWTCLQWCASCGEAICPTCHVEDKEEPLGRCQRCIAEKRKTQAYLAGEKMAREREEAILKRIFES